MFFKDRKDAGKQLAKKLIQFKNDFPIVLALPRGGVPVAAEIANELNSQLDVLVVRKIGAPFNLEFAVGAICEGAAPIFIQHSLAQTGLEPDDLDSVVYTEVKKVKNQVQLFRQGRQLPSFKNRTVIVVDDGLATGATMSAAVKQIRKSGNTKIIVAIPVGSARTIEALKPRVDEVIVLNSVDSLNSVGEWYKDFSQVEDQEVISILNTNRSLWANMDVGLR